MKKIHRVWALLMAALMAIGLMTTAFAATDSAPIIDPGKKASLSIYKYDITTAGKDGTWDAESYVSTGPSWTSWQSMPSRAWSSHTSALLTSP